MDLWLSIVSILCGVGIYLHSANYDNYLYDVVGGGGFPRLLGVIMVTCGILIGIQHAQKERKRKALGQPVKRKGGDYKAIVLMFAAVLVYVLAMEAVGYVVSSILLVVALLFIQGVRAPKTLVIPPVIIVGALYVLFAVVLRVRMPAGLLI